MAAGQAVAGLFEGRAAWPVSAPEHWIYPLQTVLCGVLLAKYWSRYELRAPSQWGIGFGVGVLVLVIWIAPQLWLGFPGRYEGFDPWYFPSPAVRGTEVALRFVRLVIVVPLVEEIFWRGFLLRWVIDPQFEKVPFGTFQWKAMAVTVIGFCLEHQMSDWAAAALAGALYNWVAFRTRSLAACVLAHAVTNLMLGLFVLRTGQWGFW